jgi:hypothetical protein
MQNLIANKNIYIFSKINILLNFQAEVGIFQISMVIFGFSGIILHPALFLGLEYRQRFAL